MTIAPAPSGSSARQSAGPIQWMSVQNGLWVGKIGGEFAGMIETRDDGFAAIRLSDQLGVFPTLGEAKAAFSRG